MDKLIKDLVLTVLNCTQFIIIIAVILSWFPNVQGGVVTFVKTVSSTVSYPFKLLLRKFNLDRFMLDFSPLLAYFAISIIASFIKML